MENGKSVVMDFKEIPMEIRKKAMREALTKIPVHQLPVILADCGLTEDEQISILESRDRADLIWISQKLNTSDRTTDRRRSSALGKLCREMEE